VGEPNEFCPTRTSGPERESAGRDGAGSGEGYGYGYGKGVKS